jgi:hypothetical protein
MPDANGLEADQPSLRWHTVFQSFITNRVLVLKHGWENSIFQALFLTANSSGRSIFNTV